MARTIEQEEVQIEKKYLTPLRVGLMQILPSETYLAGRLGLTLEDIGGQMAAKLLTSVMTETVSEHTKKLTFDFELEIPASWWDDFKDRHAPSWFVNRFPVRYRTVRRKRTRDVSFRQYVKYPNFRSVARSDEMFPVMESTINPVWEEDAQAPQVPRLH